MRQHMHTQQYVGNPAQKLLGVLDAMTRVPESVKVRNGWAKVFQIKANDWEKLLSNIAQTLALIEECRTLILRQRNLATHRPYIVALDKIANVLTSFNFNERWSVITDEISEDSEIYRTIILLKGRLDEITKSYPPSDDEIVVRLREIDTFAENVFTSDFPRELKEFLSEQIDMMREALRKYRIFGNQSLQKDLETITGRFFLDKRFQQNKSYWDQPVIKNMLETIKIVSLLTNIGKGAEHIYNLLTGP